MTDKTKAMQTAMKGLECAQEETESGGLWYAYGLAIDALREALAESEAKPVVMEPVVQASSLIPNKGIYGALYTADQLAAAVAQEREKWQADAERYRFVLQSEDFAICKWAKSYIDGKSRWRSINANEVIDAARTGEQK